MPLPQITGIQSVTVPASAEKSFPDSFITKLYVASPQSDGKQQLQVILRPYNYAIGELYDDSDRDTQLLVADIWTEAARAATFATLMGSIVQVTGWMARERVLLAKESLTAEEAAELEMIQEALGVQA